MYKLFPVISLLLLVTAGYELYKIYTLTEENSDLKEKVAKAPKSDCDVCLPTKTASVFTMDAGTLQNMRDEYKKNTMGGLNTEGPSIWFTLDDIKNFILEVQKDTCGKSCNSQLGIRIYYARYPTQFNTKQFPGYNGVTSAYAGYQTVFMVPTIDVNGNHKDFNPLDKSQSLCDKSFINLDINSSIGIRALAGKNHGELCPPVCPPGFAAFK